MRKFETIHHETDVCVVGGGLAGVCGAVAAARNGARVVIMQDRPMFGGNCSSEIRMWICGAFCGADDVRETGIIEELDLENCYRNPYKNYSVWDSVLYQLIRFQKNITVLLNCSCLDAEMEDKNRIQSITGWQLTTQQYHEIHAKIFMDCSGDSVLAPLTGAEFRWGREARSEFGESIAPELADAKTMGLSCMIQAREYPEARDYIPPFWAEKFTAEKLYGRKPNMQNKAENFWYLELGGTENTIADSETIRDSLQDAAYGIWDYVKHSGDCGDTANWDLDWVGLLPGKRESRRYVGDYILTENDILAEGRFEDMVAYGGWTMDDHHPMGLRYPGKPNIHHPAPNPFGIPYRCLYSKNIENLMFAGRNISTTHAGLSATRVMATCGTVGQAVGTAAALAVRYNTTPRGISQNYMTELQNTLMHDDAWLPWHKRSISPLTLSATVTADGTGTENLFNGIDRNVGDTDNGWFGNRITFRYDNPTYVHHVRLVFDSDLNRCKKETYYRNMNANIPLHSPKLTPPETLVKSFAVTYGGKTVTVSENHQRLVYVPVDADVTELTVTMQETWGAEQAHVFSVELF